MMGACRLYMANVRPLLAAILLASVAILMLILPTNFTVHVFQTLYSPVMAVAIYIPAFLLWEVQYIRELQNPLTMTRMTIKERVFSANFASCTSALLFSSLITIMVFVRSAINGQTILQTENRNMFVLMACCFLSISLLYKAIYLLTSHSALSFSMIILPVFYEYSCFLFDLRFQMRILMAPAFMPLSFVSSICSYVLVLLVLQLFLAFSEVCMKEGIHYNEKS